MPRLSSAAHGCGNGLLLLVTATQVLGAVLLALRPAPPAPAPPSLGLAAAAVLDSPFDRDPRALSDGAVLAPGASLQLTFTPEFEGWTAVLWFDGDRLLSLYPNAAAGEQGWTAQGASYAVPGPGQWMRLTESEHGEELVVIVSSLRPDPEITATLAAPSAQAVQRLRRRLEREADARSPVALGAERFLPTRDGRAVAVPWQRVVGAGSLVIGWRLRVTAPAT